MDEATYTKLIDGRWAWAIGVHHGVGVSKRAAEQAVERARRILAA